MIRKLRFINHKGEYFGSWGAEDRVMWEESGMDLHAQSMSNILKEMPYDVKLKQQFISLLSQCKLPILADQQVFSLLVAIVIFSSADIQLIDRYGTYEQHTQYIMFLETQLTIFTRDT